MNLPVSKNRVFAILINRNFLTFTAHFHCQETSHRSRHTAVSRVILAPRSIYGLPRIELNAVCIFFNTHFLISKFPNFSFFFVLFCLLANHFMLSRRLDARSRDSGKRRPVKLRKMQGSPDARLRLSTLHVLGQTMEQSTV